MSPVLRLSSPVVERISGDEDPALQEAFWCGPEAEFDLIGPSFYFGSECPNGNGVEIDAVPQ